jgi:hypothetical protein
MKPTRNRWIDRYARLDDLKTIRQLSRVSAVALHGLQKDPIRVAANRMLRGFQSVFVPTDASCRFMQRVIQSALGHAIANYPDSRRMLTRVYREQLDIEPYVPTLLTGPPGGGKSHIRKALERLLGEVATIDVGAGHGEIPLVASRSVNAKTRSSIIELLRPLAPPDVASGRAKCSTGRLPLECAHYAYLCGVCVHFLDELQFMTSSSSANTLIAQALLAFRHVGTPFVAVMNFSLVHKLKRRPPEERQRLLGDVTVLLPESPDSEDWNEILAQFEATVPGAFGFSFTKEASSIWSVTAGNLRNVGSLLVLGYTLAREAHRDVASWDDLERAYGHPDFAAARSDVESLLVHELDSRALPDELRCPFPLPETARGAYERSLKQARVALVAAAARDATMSQTDRKTKTFVENALNLRDTAPGSSERPVRLRRDFQSMRDAGERFAKRVKKRSDPGTPD